MMSSPSSKNTSEMPMNTDIVTEEEANLMVVIVQTILKQRKLYKKVLKQLVRIAIRKQKEKNKIIERLSKYCDKDTLDACPFFTYNKQEAWTIADLFIRQKLNNGCDGFGMKNVWRVYKFLCIHKEVLIKHKMVSERAWNNSGYPLWCDYGYDECLKTGFIQESCMI